MNEFSQDTEDYRRIEQAIQYIETNFKEQPSLDQIADSVHLSKYHFDRLFKRWAGVSPIQFLQFITLNYTKQRLAESSSILDASYDAGLSGPGRLHDLFVNYEAMTPGEFKSRAKGLEIKYGFSQSPFGEFLLATTKRGICSLTFVDESGRNAAVRQLFDEWAGATFLESPKAIRSTAKGLFRVDKGRNPKPFNLLLKGTNFQTKVWRALLEIPEGYVTSYSAVASHIGKPEAARAVASAIALNPIAYLIPCHRVITKSGQITKYRWGSTRMKAIIGWEAARTS